VVAVGEQLSLAGWIVSHNKKERTKRGGFAHHWWRRYVETHARRRYIVGLEISGMLGYCGTMYGGHVDEWRGGLVVRRLCVLHCQAKTGKKGKRENKGSYIRKCPKRRRRFGRACTKEVGAMHLPPSNICTNEAGHQDIHNELHTRPANRCNAKKVLKFDWT
jgi:hypothetical protein